MNDKSCALYKSMSRGTSWYRRLRSNAVSFQALFRRDLMHSRMHTKLRVEHNTENAKIRPMGVRS